jgi:hypothetical protein
MGKKDNKEDKSPQQVVINWADRDHQQAILYSSLFQVAAQLTQICHPNGGKPKEVLDTFIEIYEPLSEWYRGTPVKEEIKKMIDTLLPMPPGVDGRTSLE